jgi:hypothetical protein
MIANWIVEQESLTGNELEVDKCTKDSVTDHWKTVLRKGNYEYLSENLWIVEGDKTTSMKDFTDKTVVVKKEEKSEEVKVKTKACRVFFDNYKESIKGEIEEELKKLSTPSAPKAKVNGDWKVHFKPLSLTKGKSLDGKSMYLFYTKKYVVVWIGQSLTDEISQSALDVVNAALVEIRFSPYFLLDDFEEEKPYSMFVFQGKEPHRFKSLFEKWIVPLPSYYVLPPKKAPRAGFTTEESGYKKAANTLSISADPDTVALCKTLKKGTIKPRSEPMLNISAIPFTAIYGFQRGQLRCFIPIYMNRVEVYLMQDNTFIKQLGRNKYIWDTSNCYLIVVSYMASPNTPAQYSLYLWKGGNISCNNIISSGHTEHGRGPAAAEQHVLAILGEHEIQRESTRSGG